MGEKSENKQKSPKNERDRNDHENVHLSQNQQKILDELEREPGMTKQQLMKAIGVGKTTIDRGIAFLKEHGLLERVGSNKTGYWHVL